MRPGQKIYCRALRAVARLWSCTSRLLFIGDSLTAGCYPLFLVRSFREQGLPVGIRIMAKSGATTEAVYDLLRRRLRHKPCPATTQTHHRDVGVVVLLGGNDLKCGHDFQRPLFEDVFTALLGSLRDYFPRAFQTVGTYPVPGPHPRLRPNSAQIIQLELNPAIRKAARETGCHLCELENVFNAGDDLKRDGVHPTISGEQRMAEVWFKTVFPLLEATLRADGDTPI